MHRPGALRSLIRDSKEGLSLTPLQVVQTRRFVDNDFMDCGMAIDPSPWRSGMILFREPRTILGILAQVESGAINPGDLIDKLVALQQQNSEL